ncbi:MAG: type II secretion system protein GspH [Alphaproteobacteria bacterium RIFCSPHIGHO2_12_FULL_63_12]|nr:MAG: type II secretion system protein GspH [Alphaproteobacteria bacterium RIFCSPHIGHO2_12_FULL_63_12]
MVGRKIIRNAQRGLTLIELLVVIVILALASSLVLLTAPPTRPPVRDEAERFARRMELALDEAITSSRPMRVKIDALGYVFEQLDPPEPGKEAEGYR